MEREAISHAIPTEFPCHQNCTRQGWRTEVAARPEKGKIIGAISVLSRDPGILSRHDGWGNGRVNKVLNRILNKTAGSMSEKSRSTSPKDSKQGQEDFDFSALIPAEVWRKWMPVPKIPSLTSTNSKAAAISSSSAGGSSGIGPPPSDDQDWRGSSQAGLSGNSSSSYASALQAKLNAVTRDLVAKTEEHDKLKSDTASELEDLKAKHNEDLEDINKKHTDYNALKAPQNSEVEERLRRLEKEKQDAVNAVKREEQGKYAILQKKYDDVSGQIQSLMLDVSTKMLDDKKAALEKLEKEKDAAYNALNKNYESLKKQLSEFTAADATLTTDSKALEADKISLTAQLADMTTKYNILENKYNGLAKDKTSLEGKNKTLESEKTKEENLKKVAEGKVSKLTDIMNGWTVMIMMPHSRMALNANNDSHSKAHAWAFDMDNDDEIFQFEKADDKPTTPWIIKHKATGNLLVFLNKEVDRQVRCRRKGDSDINGNAAQWFIGRGSADSNPAWVLRNAEWPDICIQLVHGWAENGRQAKSFECTNAGDANWVIIPLNL